MSSPVTAGNAIFHIKKIRQCTKVLTPCQNLTEDISQKNETCREQLTYECDVKVEKKTSGEYF